MPEWEHLVIRALGSHEAELTVLQRHTISPTYVRIQVSDGGLFKRWPPFPTMWLRLWFTDQGKPHQRAFTVVDPEVSQGRFWMEFALHEGVASNWARSCSVGDTIKASLLGSTPPWVPKKRARHHHMPGHHHGPTFTLDEPHSGRTIIVGDPASLPAVNSMLERLGDHSAEVWLEHTNPHDAELPVAHEPRHQVQWVHRNGSDSGVADVLAHHWNHHPPTNQDRIWVAVEASANRRLTSTLSSQFEIPRANICATAYWRQT